MQVVSVRLANVAILQRVAGVAVDGCCDSGGDAPAVRMLLVALAAEMLQLLHPALAQQMLPSFSRRPARNTAVNVLQKGEM